MLLAVSAALWLLSQKPRRLRMLRTILILSQVIASVLEYEKPDFVALSGDMVSGFAWDGRKGWFEER